MNTIKLQSTEYMNRMQMHAYLENKKCYCMDMVETYYKCMKIMKTGTVFREKSELFKLKDTKKKIVCSVAMKMVNIKL